MMPPVFKSGRDREQGSFLPARLEDYVGADNPVRAIEAYVCLLDLAALGFCHAARSGGAGQPAYDPADLLKLYLYGYLNQIRSSRRLERETRRNVELIWLLKGLVPGYRTIGDFRKTNRTALRAANRDFVLLLRDLDLLSGSLVAIDGAFFHGDASPGSIVTAKRLAARLAALESDIAAYEAALETNDAAEAADPDTVRPSADEVVEKLAALRVKQARTATELGTLAARSETQLSRTDADARLLSKRGQLVAGYNVQIAVDERHKLIVASEVVNDGNDTGQLHALARAAQQALDVAALRVVADCGYHNGETLRACAADGIEAYVAEPRRGARLADQDRFVLAAFGYDSTADAYRCPTGKLLRRMQGGKQDATANYASAMPACDPTAGIARCAGTV